MMFKRNIITLALILLNAAAFVLSLRAGVHWLMPDAGSLLNAGANFSGLTPGGQWWRLISCMFIHIGIIHLLVNMLALYSLGSDLEEELGSMGMLVTYFTCGFSASVSSLLFNSFVVSAGASGAIFGLFGVHLSSLLSGCIPGKGSFAVHLLSALILLAVNLILGFVTDFIDTAAHLGGFAAGFIIGGFYYLTGHAKQSKSLMLAGISLIVAAIATLIFVFTPKTFSWYYSMFTHFVQNEREASRVLEDRMHGSDDNTFKAQLEEADALWNTNLQMIDSFPYAPVDLQHDLYVLKKYSMLKKQVMNLYLKSIRYDTYLFLDTVEYVNYKITNLPELKYKLDFFSRPPPKAASLIPVTIYYDREWNEVSREAGYYFRLAQKDSLQRINGLVKDYYPDSTVQMKGYYTNDLKDGVFFYFYPNGWYESAGMYNNDVPVGKWQYFYPNRQIKSEERYDMGNNFFVNLWDENGAQLISDGNGFFFDTYPNGQLKETGFYKNGLKDSAWKGFYEDGSLHYAEQWKNGKLLKGKSKAGRGREAAYDTVYVQPAPFGGFEKFMEYIQEKISYPNYATKKYPEGTVIIELTVDTDGTIRRMEALTKIGAECGQQAMEIIKHGTKFHPARLRGFPVKEKLQIPFKFKSR